MKLTIALDITISDFDHIWYTVCLKRPILMKEELQHKQTLNLSTVGWFQLWGSIRHGRNHKTAER